MPAFFTSGATSSRASSLPASSRAAPPVGSWSTSAKIAAAVGRSKIFLPPQLAHEVDALLSSENLALAAGTLTLWAGSHLFGVGELVDVALLLMGAFTVGWSITQVLDQLLAFGGAAVHAKDDRDLDRAARAFAAAAVAAGITAIMAVLLRRSAESLRSTRGLSLREIAVPEQPGLVNVDPPPEANGLFSKSTVTGTRSLPAGEGNTTAFGDVTYSTAGSASERQLTRLHELVHSFLSPRFRLMRGFRARLAMSAYARSAIVRYLEEALAESFAQLRVNGVAGLLTGVRFPITNGYLSLQQLLCEGAEIGKILLGTQRFSIQYLAGPSSRRL
jgi:hypothetical protein